MTVVVGVRWRRGVLLAADSQWSNENDNRKGVSSKVANLSDVLAIGFCGSPRFGQILTYELKDHLEDPSLTMDEEYWVVREFIPRLRAATEAHGHLHVHHNVETFGPSAFLLAVRGRLFCVENEFSVLEHFLPYEAVGSGQEVAIGSLRADLGEERSPIPTVASADRVARKAVSAAIELTNYVGGPVRTVRTTSYTADEKALARRILRSHAARQ